MADLDLTAEAQWTIEDVEPEAREAAKLAARKAGVEAICYGARISPEEILVDRPIPLEKTPRIVNKNP